MSHISQAGRAIWHYLEKAPLPITEETGPHSDRAYGRPAPYTPLTTAGAPGWWPHPRGGCGGSAGGGEWGPTLGRCVQRPLGAHGSHGGLSTAWPGFCQPRHQGRPPSCSRTSCAKATHAFIYSFIHLFILLWTRTMNAGCWGYYGEEEQSAKAGKQSLIRRSHNRHMIVSTGKVNRGQADKVAEE